MCEHCRQTKRYVLVLVIAIFFSFFWLLLRGGGAKVYILDITAYRNIYYGL